MNTQSVQAEEMKVLDYEFYHQGCYATALTSKFPEIQFVDEGVHSFEKDGFVCELDKVTITAPNRDLINKALMFLKSQKQVKKMIVISKTENSAELFCWVAKPLDVSFKYIIPRNMALAVGSVFEKGGNTYGRVMCPASNFGVFMEDYESRGVLKIKSITRFNQKENELTPAEELAIKTAIKFGYYSWPRKMTLEELGERIGLSRRGFQDNLRRAEKKVMNSWKER